MNNACVFECMFLFMRSHMMICGVAHGASTTITFYGPIVFVPLPMLLCQCLFCPWRNMGNGMAGHGNATYRIIERGKSDYVAEGIRCWVVDEAAHTSECSAFINISRILHWPIESDERGTISNTQIKSVRMSNSIFLHQRGSSNTIQF